MPRTTPNRTKSSRPDQTQPDQVESGRFRFAIGDRWIWIVWGLIALVSIAVLPFASRGIEVARAIASFCGFVV